MTTTAEVLRQAANLVEEHGHMKKDLWKAFPQTHEAGQPVSAAGAIKLAARDLLQSEEDRVEQAQKALEALRVELDVPTYPAIFGWNDAPERTPEDVVQALQRSAVQAETDHG